MRHAISVLAAIALLLSLAACNGLCERAQAALAEVAAALTRLEAIEVTARADVTSACVAAGEECDSATQFLDDVVLRLEQARTLETSARNLVAQFCPADPSAPAPAEPVGTRAEAKEELERIESEVDSLSMAVQEMDAGGP